MSLAPVHSAQYRSVWALGVESGGTRSSAILADGAGALLGHGECSFGDPVAGRGPGGSGRSDQSMRTAVHRALACVVGEAIPTRLYVLGRSRLPEGSLSPSLAEVAHYLPVREQDGPLALADASSGVVVLSGTGAFVYGRRPDGRELMLDALGPLLGDAGSAFDIGLRALRAIARAPWHPRHETSLVEPLTQACAAYAGGGERFCLVSYMLQHRDRAEIASLAKIVNAHAEAGDTVACRVLTEAADAISETLSDVLDALDLRGQALPLVAAGSVARRSRVFWNRVCDRAFSMAPRLTPVVPTLAEVVGVMLAGTRYLSDLSTEFGHRLRSEASHL